MKLTIILISILLSSCSSLRETPNIHVYEVSGKYYVGLEVRETRKRVVIIDTGLQVDKLTDAYMCKDVALISYTRDYKPYHLHGTNIVSIIASHINSSKYCITMIRVNTSFGGHLQVYKGLKLIDSLDNTYLVNLSLQKLTYSLMFYQSIKKSLQRGIYFNVAAGNSQMDLDAACYNYPACYGLLLRRELGDEASRFKVIGAIANYTNYGSAVDIYLGGKPMGTPRMAGTSMSTALYTGFMVRR